MTANRNMIEEIARGALALLCFVLAALTVGEQPLLATILFVAAFVPLRGCAFCWAYGLFRSGSSCPANQEQKTGPL
jgi:hypothetical protein